MADRAEEKLYAPCRLWLETFLREKFQKSEIIVLPNTDRTKLRDILVKHEFAVDFPEASAWEVRVDVAACVRKKKGTDLAFVELKTKPITLVDVGQLLGYSRVCRPVFAFLLSPEGLSGDLHRLLTTYGRTDVLDYGDRHIHVGRWDPTKKSPDWGTLIPSGVMSSL